MAAVKTTRTLSVQLTDGPAIYAQAELTDSQYDQFLKKYCTKVGDQYYLNSLVGKTGLVVKSYLSIVTAFKVLSQFDRRWKVFKSEFVKYHWSK